MNKSVSQQLVSNESAVMVYNVNHVREPNESSQSELQVVRVEESKVLFSKKKVNYFLRVDWLSQGSVCIKMSDESKTFSTKESKYQSAGVRKVESVSCTNTVN